LAGTFELSSSSARQQQTTLFLNQFWQVSFFQLINSASAFFVNIVIARLVGPKVFGDFFFFVSTALVATILFDFGLTRTLLRYSAFHQSRGELSEKLSYYSAVLRLKTLLGLSVFVLLATLSYLLLPALKWHFILGLFTGLVVSYCQFLSAVAQTEDNYTAYNLVLSFNTLRLALVGVFVILGTLTTKNVYLLFLVAPIILSTWPAWKLGQDLWRARSAPEQNFYTNLIHFGKWMILLAVLETIVQRLDVFLVRFLTDAESAGVYSGALAFFGVVYLLPAYIAVLVYPRLVEAVGKGDESAFAHHYHFSTSLIALFGIPLALGLWAIAPDLVHLFLGEQFAKALPLFFYLAIYALLWACQINSGAVFFAKDKPKVVVGIVAMVLLVNGGLNLFLIPRFGILGAGMAIALAMAVSGALYWSFIKIYFNLFPVWRHLAVYLFSGSLMAFGVRLLPLDGWLGLSAKLVVGIFVYALAILVWHKLLPSGSLPLGFRIGGLQSKSS
jgi:O-antigen/teichoic acid export membrane protein